MYFYLLQKTIKHIYECLPTYKKVFYNLNIVKIYSKPQKVRLIFVNYDVLRLHFISL